MIDILIKKGELGHSTQGEHRVKMKAEMGEMLQGSRESQRSLATHQKPGERRGTDFSPQGPYEELTLPTCGF